MIKDQIPHSVLSMSQKYGFETRECDNSTTHRKNSQTARSPIDLLLDNFHLFFWTLNCKKHKTT